MNRIPTLALVLLVAAAPAQAGLGDALKKATKKVEDSASKATGKSDAAKSFKARMGKSGEELTDSLDVMAIVSMDRLRPLAECPKHGKADRSNPTAQVEHLLNRGRFLQRIPRRGGIIDPVAMPLLSLENPVGPNQPRDK